MCSRTKALVSAFVWYHVQHVHQRTAQSAGSASEPHHPSQQALKLCYNSGCLTGCHACCSASACRPVCDTPNSYNTFITSLTWQTVHAEGCMMQQVEAELQELEEAEAQEYLEGLGVQEGGLRSLIAATYKQLGLLTYFTTGMAILTYCTTWCTTGALTTHSVDSLCTLHVHYIINLCKVLPPPHRQVASCNVFVYKMITKACQEPLRLAPISVHIAWCQCSMQLASGGAQQRPSTQMLC